MTADPAETLRRAAAMLREAAEAATPGPWSIVPGASNVWRFPDEGAPTLVVCGLGNTTDRRVRKEDAAYIALVDPVVGAKLADLLDTEAKALEFDLGVGLTEAEAITGFEPVIALARAVLREEA